MFDKKNTMILTIVAVATLLVAVVGATFAYFSTGIGGSSTTKATVTTATPGSIIIDGGGETLTLKVSVSDMSPTNQGKKYYALNSVDTAQQNGESIHSEGTTDTTGHLYTIARASIKDNNGGTGVTYSCGYTVTVKPIENSVNGKFAGLNLVLSGPGIGTGGTETIDLSDLTSEGISKNGTFSLTGPNGASELKAGLYLENKNDDGGQNSLQGQSVNYQIEVKGTSCQLLATDSD